MPYVKCCEHNRKAQFFKLETPEGYSNSILKVINYVCPECGNFIVEVEKTDFSGEKSTKRTINDNACDLLQTLKNSILYEIKSTNVVVGNFYLNCNEFGRITKCRSNLSTLKMGRTENGQGVKEYQKQQNFLKVI